MEKIFFEQGLDSTEIQPPKKGIRDVAVPQVSRAAHDKAVGYDRPYGNEQLNSRITRSLPKGTWNVEWQAKVDPEFPPQYVLQDGDFIMVQAGELRLFNRKGTLVASGRLGGSPIVLDKANSLFYRVIPGGYLAGGSLNDGHQVFLFQPAYGDMFSRNFLTRRGDRLLVAGFERLLDPEGRKQPEKSVIEAMDLGNPIQTDDLGLLTSGKPVGELHILSPHMSAAMQGETIIIAVPNRIYLANPALEVRLALEGNFEAEVMSLDELGRIYLVVSSDNGRELWLLTQDGERLYLIGHPDPIPEPVVPPVVGYDHQVYILGKDQIVAVGPTGKRLWSRSTGGGVVGGVVTPDDQLLISDGKEIIAFDQTGQHVILHSFTGEVLRTPPVLTDQGELLVASDKHLYCLKVKDSKK